MAEILPGEKKLIDGQPHIYDYEQGQWVPEQTPGESFMRSMAGGAEFTGAGINQMLGGEVAPEMAARGEQFMEGAWQNPLSSFFGRATVPTVMGGPALATGGVAAPMVAEGMLQAAMHYGPLSERALVGSLGAAGGAVGGVIGRASFPKSISMPQASQGILRNAQDAANEFMASARGRASASFGRETDVEGFPMHELHRRRLEGDTSPETVEGIIALENSPRGRRIAGEQDAALTREFSEYFGTPLRSGKMRQDIQTARGKAGQEMGAIEQQFPFEQVDDEFLDELQSIALNYDHKIADQIAERGMTQGWAQFNDFASWITKQGNRAQGEAKLALNAADEAVRAQRARAITDEAQRAAYDAARKKYARASRLLDTPNAINQAQTAINIRSYANSTRRGYRSQREGQIQDRIDQMVDVMERVSARETKGSPTYEKTRNLILGAGLAGVTGAGLLGL